MSCIENSAHRSRESVVSLEFPALLSPLSHRTASKVWRRQTWCLIICRISKKAHFTTSIMVIIMVTMMDQTCWKHCLCILNDKPTWWIPVYSHFLDEETKTLNGLSCLPYIGQHSSDWLPFFPLSSLLRCFSPWYICVCMCV